MTPNKLLNPCASVSTALRNSNRDVLVTFLVAVTKYLSRRNCKGEGFILAPSLRGHIPPEGKVWSRKKRLSVALL